MAALDPGRRPPAALADVDLHHERKHHVRQGRTPPATSFLWLLLKAFAEVVEQVDEVIAFVDLGLVVVRPGLSVALAIIRHGDPPTTNDFHAEYVLAERCPLLVVRASAGRLPTAVVHDPGAAATLRGHQPLVLPASPDLARPGDLHTPFLARFHRALVYT